MSIKSNDARSVFSPSLLHVADDNDDPNLILQQIFIVIAFVFHPLFYLSGVPFLTIFMEKLEKQGIDKGELTYEEISIHVACLFQSTNK